MRLQKKKIIFFFSGVRTHTRYNTYHVYAPKSREMKRIEHNNFCLHVCEIFGEKKWKNVLHIPIEMGKHAHNDARRDREKSIDIG